MGDRYRDYNTYLRERFGCRVQKITLDAGLGCPNRDGRIGSGGCIYCNAKGSGTGAHAKGLSIREQLEAGIERMRRRYKAEKFIAYFQSFSNTYAPIDVLERLYSEALGVPDVVGLSIGTRPDCIDPDVLHVLSGFASRCLLWMEYGLQSSHDRTLKAIHRGHDRACFEKAVRETRAAGIPVCAHIILGLPGEDRRMMLDTARFLADLDIDGIKIHLLYVVRGTPMEALFRSGAYRCLEREAYVDTVCDILSLLPPSTVIHRLTGDPHPDELVAPLWALEKQRNMDAIRRRLEERNIVQGICWRKEAGR
uniref:TIGR01212 family radical SAM protein n=1 Tax=Desulfatirhabdium butyrativorans TaxID=340467 RepID=A0A7C4VRL4_9BACT